MNRGQKQEEIKFLKNVFANLKSVVLTANEGLNAMDVAEIRKQLKNNGICFKAVKNSLVKIAIQNSIFNCLSVDFSGSTAITWSDRDVITLAKILVDFQKNIKNFTIKTGFYNGVKLDISDIKSFALMPSLIELRVRILNLIFLIPSKFLFQVNIPALCVMDLIKANNEKKK